MTAPLRASSMPSGLAQPTAADAIDLIALLRRLTGISLAEDKAGFLAARLARRLAETGCADFGAYRRLLATDEDERTCFAEALVTHTTSFFRERTQFDWLIAEEFPRLAAESRNTPLVLWSAASSTGQEGYTALMAARMAEMQYDLTLDVGLIGTDLSRAALRTAATAIYPLAQIDGVPESLRSEVLLSSREGLDRVRIVQGLRRRSSWRCANLATGEGLEGIQADVVFLRNVLIYFDTEMRDRVIDNVCRRLRPGGVLCVGHTEAGHVRRAGLTVIRPSILRWEG